MRIASRGGSHLPEMSLSLGCLWVCVRKTQTLTVNNWNSVFVSLLIDQCFDPLTCCCGDVYWKQKGSNGNRRGKKMLESRSEFVCVEF